MQPLGDGGRLDRRHHGAAAGAGQSGGSAEAALRPSGKVTMSPTAMVFT
jgi:hypothetical protein